MKLLACIALIFIGWMIGWRHAHITVAAECERLGAFFVGSQVYRCVAIEKKESQSVAEASADE